jgi:hypothetical protein
VLSYDVDGDYVHFVRGRSLKCKPKDCEPCKRNVERRWRGYLICANARTRAITLVELTAAAMGPIDIYFRKVRTLRGALLETKRIPEKINGRLYSTITEGAQDIASFPKVPSVRSILRKLWGLPKADEGNEIVNRKIRVDDDNPDSHNT